MTVRTRILAAAFLAGSLASGHARADYKFTRVDGPAPNAGGTRLSGINNHGVLAGITYDADFNEQGFLGPASGPFTAFGIPYGEAWTIPHQTQIASINDYNEILGYVPRSLSNGFEGFMFEIYNTELITFPVPWQLLGATALSMNDSDVIAGAFPNGAKTSGYTLDIWNRLTAFDATPDTTWTSASGINNSGTVVGNYLVPHGAGTGYAGFLRASNGKITLLATPKSIGGVVVGPLINYTGINDGGVTVGWFLDPTNVSHGFVRDASGKFTLIQYPSGTSSRVVGINNSGTLVGDFTDEWGDPHGFIATPSPAH
jgi:hypothetical protein